MVIVKPETLIGWHRKGFKLFWKWKSQAGRPRIPENVRNLIVQMAQENPTRREIGGAEGRIAGKTGKAYGQPATFNPGTIQDHATFEKPMQYASGVSEVLVNGVEVVKAEEHTGAKPGRVVRPGR